MYKLILIVFILHGSAWSSRIKEVFNFKQIYFSSTNETFKNDSKPKPANAMIMTLERWKNKLFLVTPRLKPDVLATLSYINITSIILNIIYIPKYYYACIHLMFFLYLYRYGKLQK